MSLVQICCIVEMITSPWTCEVGTCLEIKTNTIPTIHGPCFHAFLVLINPLWCLEGFKINYSLQNWQTTLRTPEHILDFSSVSVRTAQDDKEVFERGHSWNVNTQKESSIRQSPDLCHASIFLFLCVSVFLWGRQKMEPYNCTVICSGPLFCPSMRSLVAMSHLCATLLWYPPEQWHIHSFLPAVWNSTACFSPSGWKSWITVRTFVH